MMMNATDCSDAPNSTCAAALNAADGVESVSRKIIRILCLLAVILCSGFLCHFSWKNRAKAFEEVKRLKDEAANQAEQDKKKKGKGTALSQAAQIKEIHEASLIMKKDLDRKNAEFKKKEDEKKDKNTFFTRVFVYLLDKSFIFSTICDYLAVLFYPTKIAFEFLWPKIIFGYEALAIFNKLPIPFLKLGDISQILYIFNLVVLSGQLLWYGYEFLEFIYLKDVADLFVRVVTISIIFTCAILRQIFLGLTRMYRGLLCNKIESICVDFEDWAKKNYYKLPEELNTIKKHIKLEELMQKSGIDEMINELFGYLGKFGNNFVLNLPPAAQNITESVIEAFAQPAENETMLAF